MADAQYTVAPGNSFTAAGIVYVGGDVIPAAVFINKNELARLVSAGRIIEKVEKKAEPKPVDSIEAAAEVPVKKTSRKKDA